MKKKYLAAFILVGSTLAAPIFAADMFQKMLHPEANAKITPKIKALMKGDNGSNFTDFTGSWTGSCSQPDTTITMNIENSDTEFTLDGQELSIGSLNTWSISHKGYTYIAHAALKWDETHSSILFKISDIDYYPDNNESIFSTGNGTLSLKNDQLIFEQHITSEGKNIDNVCTMMKK